jgi:hypothetical protein
MHESGRIGVQKDKDSGNKDGDNNAQRNQKRFQAFEVQHRKYVEKAESHDMIPVSVK